MKRRDPGSIVVFGLDPEGKPRAGRFAERDARRATKAAHLLGYQVVRIRNPSLAEKLPQGDVFASTTSFVRRVSWRAFNELIAALDEPSPETSKREQR